jgi:bis(5'-nucleosyl)-tetraphosphatase (symmetrical)
MADYAIGDLQGHYDALQRLLDKIDYCPTQDQLWFVGDLVNRGPKSLEILRFLKSLRPQPKICLGNHDLYLLFLMHQTKQQRIPELLQAIFLAPDRDELAYWLRQQDFFIHHPTLNCCITHAGIAPMWSIDKAKQLNLELKQVCQHDEIFMEWMMHYFQHRPSIWDDKLDGLPRWQIIADYFTRMRFTNYHGGLDWQSHQSLSHTPKDCYPWFACPKKETWNSRIVFGHWASLLGKTGLSSIQNIDTGYNWGGVLTALNLHNFERFTTF